LSGYSSDVVVIFIYSVLSYHSVVRVY